MIEALKPWPPEIAALIEALLDEFLAELWVTYQERIEFALDSILENQAVLEDFTE